MQAQPIYRATESSLLSRHQLRTVHEVRCAPTRHKHIHEFSHSHIRLQGNPKVRCYESKSGKGAPKSSEMLPGGRNFSLGSQSLHKKNQKRQCNLGEAGDKHSGTRPVSPLSQSSTRAKTGSCNRSGHIRSLVVASICHDSPTQLCKGWI